VPSAKVKALEFVVVHRGDPDWPDQRQCLRTAVIAAGAGIFVQKDPPPLPKSLAAREFTKWRTFGILGLGIESPLAGCVLFTGLYRIMFGRKPNEPARVTHLIGSKLGSTGK